MRSAEALHETARLRPPVEQQVEDGHAMLELAEALGVLGIAGIVEEAERDAGGVEKRRLHVLPRQRAGYVVRSLRSVAQVHQALRLALFQGPINHRPRQPGCDAENATDRRDEAEVHRAEQRLPPAVQRLEYR